MANSGKVATDISREMEKVNVNLLNLIRASLLREKLEEEKEDDIEEDEDDD